MAIRGRIFFHAPCFDGLVSAALTADFLTESGRWAAAIPAGVNYGLPRPWAADPKGPFAIVDFVFDARAEFWADHHATTFENEGARRLFTSAGQPSWLYDPTAPSCARLLWDRLKQVFGYRNRRFKAMVGWATKIDSAAYRSVEEVFDSTHAALRLNLALSQLDLKACERLVRVLRREDLDTAAAQPTIRKAADRARALSDRGLEKFRRSARLEDDIVVFDVDASDSIVNRYAPYRFFPKARYSAGIIRGKDQVKITAMRNPWKRFRSAPLGEIFRPHGGGGHQRVASVVLEAAAARRAPDVLAKVVSKILEQDRASA